MGGVMVDMSAGVKLSGTTWLYPGIEKAERLAIAKHKTVDRVKILALIDTFNSWSANVPHSIAMLLTLTLIVKALIKGKCGIL
jgi:hypothetical protein